MHVAVIGGGIVGTTIAATIQKYHGHHPLTTKTQVTIIDDKRQHQTSLAGQGYLWSIHRCSSPTAFESSVKAKHAWIDLLGGDDDSESTEVLLQKRGSLLIAPSSLQEQLLKYYDIAKDTIPILAKGRDENSKNLLLQFLPDASTCCDILLPSICGIYYQGDDYTCTPSHLIKALMERYSNINIECRTVNNLEVEKQRYDCIICCTGPWINELNSDLGVKPIRGILLELEQHQQHEYSNIRSGSRSGRSGRSGRRSKFDKISSDVPMMEFGYGTLGIHFTLSSRNEHWLLGASREDVAFSLDNVDNVIEKLITRSKEFVKEDVLDGVIKSRKIGFRPAVYEQHNNNDEKKPFQIMQDSDGVVYCYGFEGQGVLYAALAANEVMKVLPLK